MQMYVKLTAAGRIFIRLLSLFELHEFFTNIVDLLQFRQDFDW